MYLPPTVRLLSMGRHLAMGRHPAIARQTSTAGHRPTVLLPLMARHLAIARQTSMARHRPTVRLPVTRRRQPTAMTGQTTMVRQLITVRLRGRRTQFRMPFRRAATRYAPRRVIASGNVVRGAVRGGGCAIQRSLRQSTMRDLTAATLIAAILHHRVRATALIEVRPRVGACNALSAKPRPTLGLRQPSPAARRRTGSSSPRLAAATIRLAMSSHNSAFAGVVKPIIGHYSLSQPDACSSRRASLS